MILVTGGTGLLGSHLLYDLVKSGQKVRAVKRPGSDTSATRKVFSYYSAAGNDLFSKIDWTEGDVLDPFSLLQAMDGIEQVYHCAARVVFDRAEHEKMLLVNVEGTANVVNAALEKKTRKLCHVSSIAALGRNLNTQEITENTFWRSSPDNSVYSISKYGAERETWRGVQEGLDTVIVNPSLIIGPGNWNKSSSNMFVTAYRGLKYYTKGVTGFVDVRDVSKAMILLMNSEIKNERFIISSENAAYSSFFKLAAECFGKKKPFIRVSPLGSELAWRALAVKKLLTGRKSIITKETAKAAHQKNHFSNEKIKKMIPIDFIPLKQSVIETCRIFLKDKDHDFLPGPTSLS